MMTDRRPTVIPVLWLFVVLAAVLVFVMAAVVIGRETGRLAAAPPRPVFDLEEAVGWVADRLPDELSGRLSYDELRSLLGWGVEHLAATGDDEIVVADADTCAHVLALAVEAGIDVAAADVEVVLDRQVAYLEAIGAAGPQAEI
jgi:hypothetical protein